MLDLPTTLAFLAAGVQEGNPLVALAMSVAPTPLQALLAVKVIALLSGYQCWRTGRRTLLARVNWCFAVLVAWNLVALLAASRQAS